MNDFYMGYLQKAPTALGRFVRKVVIRTSSRILIPKEAIETPTRNRCHVNAA